MEIATIITFIAIFSIVGFSIRNYLVNKSNQTARIERVKKEKDGSKAFYLSKDSKKKRSWKFIIFLALIVSFSILFGFDSSQNTDTNEYLFNILPFYNPEKESWAGWIMLGIGLVSFVLFGFELKGDGIDKKYENKLILIIALVTAIVCVIILI